MSNFSNRAVTIADPFPAYQTVTDRMTGYAGTIQFPNTALLGSIKLALPFLFLLALWSTTPLVIKWSMSGGIPFTLAVFMRFLVAGCISAVLLLRCKGNMFFDPRHWRAWLITGGASGIGMITSYWALQYISSGVAAVCVGLMPIFSALLSWLLLNDKLSGREFASIVIPLFGMALIFSDNIQLGPDSLRGILVAMASMLVMASGPVLLKREKTDISPKVINHGSQIVTAAITVSAWLAYGAPLPEAFPSMLAISATLFMGIIGSVVAFTVFYKLVLTHRPVTVSSIKLVTPVIALWLGYLVNDEVVTLRIISGSALVFIGLVMFLILQQARHNASQRR